MSNEHSTSLYILSRISRGRQRKGDVCLSTDDIVLERVTEVDESRKESAPLFRK